MTPPSVIRRDQGRRRRVSKEAQKAERSLRIAMLNANGEQLRAFIAREWLDKMVIQDAQIGQDTVINRLKFSRCDVKSHIVGSGGYFHSQLIMVRQRLEVRV